MVLGGDDRKATVAALFAGWAAPVPTPIECTEESAILRNAIVDRPPTREWGRGPVTLLGDAAHPMTPNLGRGGCQAIEDAVVLGEELGRATSPQEALRRYEDRRRDRASWFVEQSWGVGRAAQWRSPLACFVRNAGFRTFGGAAMCSTSRRAWTFDG